ncbi:hypothetical protein ACHMWN_07740 [Pedobacter sp. UC225_61]|uniref:hypothetical protein n=1 Tax=Pedobacter sp. UC225_61 TaxID=3374623 RepID=UPI00379A560A
MTKTKIIILIVGVIIIGFLGALLSAGNNAYSQKYEFYCEKELMIKKLTEFKKENPNLQPAKETGLTDSYAKDQYYYHSYFYWQDEDRIIHILTSQKDNEQTKSIISFEAVNEGLTLGHWKRINKDFDRKENIRIKSKFEKELLNKLKLNYKNLGNDMFIFWK